MNPASGPDSLGSSPEYYQFATLALFAAAFADGGVLKGKRCRAIKSHVDASLKLKRKNSADGSAYEEAFVCKAGDREDVQFIGFTEAGSTAVGVDATNPIKVYL